MCWHVLDVIGSAVASMGGDSSNLTQTKCGDSGVLLGHVHHAC
jgi:hypothetical protein